MMEGVGGEPILLVVVSVDFGVGSSLVTDMCRPSVSKRWNYPVDFL